MDNNFRQIEPMRFWMQKVLPQVYDDCLSHEEVLYKVKSILNELIKNVNSLPEYIQDTIKGYISSGEIEKVLRDVMTALVINVKNPPNNLLPASGDGSTDDTSAIQGCINYARDMGGALVSFPSGAYLSQPLTLYNNVSLVGSDRNNTKIVLKGGATKALISGTIDGVTVKDLTLDANMDVQVNNINTLDVIASNSSFQNLILKDGYKLMRLTANGGNIQISNIVYDYSVVSSLELIKKETTVFQINNVVFNSVSILKGECAINCEVDNVVLSNIITTATVPAGIIISGNNCSFYGVIKNAQTDYLDYGSNNTFSIVGKSSVERVTDKKEIVAKDIVLTSNNPLTYSEPADLNDYFKCVEFKGVNGVIYKVLVDKGAEIGVAYLQETEPSNINKNTVWYQINGELAIDGVAVSNAETTDNEPTSNLWFDPIN